MAETGDPAETPAQGAPGTPGDTPEENPINDNYQTPTNKNSADDEGDREDH